MILYLSPWQRRLYFWQSWFVCLSVSLFVCLLIKSLSSAKSYEEIDMKFYGWVKGGKINMINFLWQSEPS